MIVVCIDKPPFSLHLDCLALLISLNRFGFNRVVPMKYSVFFIGTSPKFEKGTKKLKRLDFILVRVIFKKLIRLFPKRNLLKFENYNGVNRNRM